MIADIQNGFVLWYIFFTDNGDFGSADEQNDAKRPLYMRSWLMSQPYG